mmetsp:Transcript_23850/g.66789  ORF Transcript_23850/g.66789 Transcript_23850/m.66789 type:complete len:239 (+) Transcript_23850:710-1426(+)
MPKCTSKDMKLPPVSDCAFSPAYVGRSKLSTDPSRRYSVTMYSLRTPMLSSRKSPRNCTTLGCRQPMSMVASTSNSWLLMTRDWSALRVRTVFAATMVVPPHNAFFTSPAWPEPSGPWISMSSRYKERCSLSTAPYRYRRTRRVRSIAPTTPPMTRVAHSSTPTTAYTTFHGLAKKAISPTSTQPSSQKMSESAGLQHDNRGHQKPALSLRFTAVSSHSHSGVGPSIWLLSSSNMCTC